MTPTARNQLHAILDRAINLDASVSLNIHPRYLQDESTIKSPAVDADKVDQPRWESGHDYVRFSFDGIEPLLSNASVVVFDTIGDRERPAVANGTSIDGRSWDVV